VLAQEPQHSMLTMVNASVLVYVSGIMT